MIDGSFRQPLYKTESLPFLFWCVETCFKLHIKWETTGWLQRSIRGVKTALGDPSGVELAQCLSFYRLTSTNDQLFLDTFCHQLNQHI